MRAMKIVTVIVRLLYGLAFTVFGLNFFFNFIPAPPPTGLAGDYFKVLAASHYLYVIGAVQLVSGVLLLIGRFVPLALTMLAAMIFNILWIHILMDPSGLPMALVFAAIELFLVWSYRDRFGGVLRP
jgi:putative oxidoreductase